MSFDMDDDTIRMLQRAHSPGKWRFDPRTLMDHDLARLQVLIGEVVDGSPLNNVLRNWLLAYAFALSRQCRYVVGEGNSN